MCFGQNSNANITIWIIYRDYYYTINKQTKNLLHNNTDNNHKKIPCKTVATVELALNLTVDKSAADNVFD